MKLLKLILFALLVVILNNQVFPTTTGTVKGYVLDKDTGTSVDGAVIFIYGTNISTVSDFHTGRYSIKNVPFGNYTLKCRKYPFQILTTEITFTQSHPRIKYDLKLSTDFLSLINSGTLSKTINKKPSIKSPILDEKGFGTLSGIVIDSFTNFPIPGARVVLSGTCIGALVNPTDGTYFISKIPSGIYTVIFSCIGYNNAIIDSVIIKADSLTVISFSLGAQAFRDYLFDEQGYHRALEFDDEVFMKLRYNQSQIKAIPHKSFGKVIEVLAQ